MCVCARACVCSVPCANARRNVWLNITAQTVISAMHTLSLLPIIQESQAEELKCSRSCWRFSADRTAVSPPQSEVKIAIRTWTADGGRHFNITLMLTAAVNCYSQLQSSHHEEEEEELCQECH